MAEHEGAPCQCGEKMVMRTVKKAGRNQGRNFYCCPRGQGNQCGTFMWEEDYLQSKPPAPTLDESAVMAALAEIQNMLRQVIANQGVEEQVPDDSPPSNRRKWQE